LSTLAATLIVAGDINVRQDRPADPATVQLSALLASRGLSGRVSDPTHDRGDLLDIVATRDDLPTPSVNVIDVGLSDHHLLRCSMPSACRQPVYTTSVRGPWSKVNVDDLRAAILSSRLGPVDLLPDDVDVDTLAALYDADLLAITDRLASARTVTVRRQPSDPWFDDECRASKRSVRQAERLFRRCPSADNTAAWSSRRCDYRALLRVKRNAFWRDRADAASGNTRELWSTFDSILGRGRIAASSGIGASTLHEFFDQKVDKIRKATSHADPPTFTSVPIDCDFSSLGTVTVDDVITAI